SPAPLIDGDAFWKSFGYQASLAREPYAGQEPIASWLFHARTLAIALGPAGLVAALAGLVLLARRRGGLAVAGFPIASLLLFASMPFAFARLDVPALPLLALAAGVALAEVASRLDAWKREKRAFLACLLLV